MATYKTTKCPYCNIVLESMRRTNWNDFSNDIGLPIEHCPNCNKPYKTGRLLWKNMNKQKKINIHFKFIVSVIVQPIFWSVALYIILFIIGLFSPNISNRIEKTPDSQLFIILYSITFVLSTFILTKVLKNLKETE